jgi:hypothetical protein
MTMKGSFLDPLILFIFIFVIAIVFVVLNYVYQEIDATNPFNSSVEANAVWHTQTDLFSMWDGVVAMLVIGVAIAMIASGFFIPSHPVFFVAMIFIAAITGMILAPLSNVFESMTVGTSLSHAANSLPLTVSAMHWLPWIAIVVAFIIAIVMYGKPGGGPAR